MDKVFEDLLKDPDIVNIMNKVSSKFQNNIDFDEIQSVKLDTLWRCLQNYDSQRGAKFTTYLHNQLNYAFRNNLKKQKPQVNLGELHTNVVGSHDYSRDAHDLVSGLPTDISQILEQRYLYNMTMVEIGKANGYSRETARRRLKNAIKICRKKHRDLI
jgi:RNA polymerase sigma factor (sigma-70 family)